MSISTRLLALVVASAIGMATAPAYAGTKYQTNLVPSAAGSTPGFQSNGSSVKVDDKLVIKGKIKKVVDGAGALGTTDVAEPLDDYSIEMDLAVAAAATTGTIVVKFDVKKGNGKFSADISGDAVFVGTTAGQGVTVTAVRVKDAGGNVLGVGGFALK